MALRFGLLGAFSAFVSVAAGAFGAHALRGVLDPARLDVFEVAVRYQAMHALALLFVACAVDRVQSSSARRAGWSFAIGTLLFSGSLYGLALSGIPWLGAITPLGGLGFLAGWAFLAHSLLEPKSG
jgi:uncharacterized membrane protein YgdD (TMEM256/DUF423 family)